MMKVTFDLLAPIYDAFMPAPDPEQLRRLLRLPTPGRMLDAGGGTGRVASRLLPMVGSLVVNDLSAPMLARAQAKGTLRPVQSDVERLPFADGCFSRVFAVDAFHHFSDHQAAVRELVRVLSPHGRLVIKEPDIQRFSIKLVALIERLGGMDSHFRSGEEISALVAARGLDPRIVCLSSFFTCVVADKGQRGSRGCEAGDPGGACSGRATEDGRGWNHGT